MRLPGRIHLRLAASLALVLMLAILVPMSAGAAGPAMKQTKRYESASSVNGSKVDEPVTFRVPRGARSVRIAIVDDRQRDSAGVGVSVLGGDVSVGDWPEVRAIVEGDVVRRAYGCSRVLSGVQYYFSCASPPYDVCSTHPRKLRLTRGARVLTVSPDAGLGPYETFFSGNGDPESCSSPLSFPTSGTITVLFSRRG